MLSLWHLDFRWVFFFKMFRLGQSSLNWTESRSPCRAFFCKHLGSYSGPNYLKIEFVLERLKWLSLVGANIVLLVEAERQVKVLILDV